VVSFTLNTRPVSVEIDPATPLLWAIRDHVGLMGTKYGCGAGLCGACTVHVDGAAVRSCQTQMSQVAGKKVVTIEGLSPQSSHPLQKAWIAEEVPQCGYCQSGQIMQAAALLAQNPKPSRAEIVQQMELMREQVSGVSLDEEAANMMKFQRAYEANARFFQAIDSTLESLMSLAG